MKASSLVELLERAGLRAGRVLALSSSGQENGSSEKWLLQRAAVGTARHGIIWRGDLNLDRERHLLGRVAAQIDLNLYVLDEQGVLAVGQARPASQRLAAVWWTRLRRGEEDQFLSAKHYESWHRQGKPLPKRTLQPPGPNWADRFVAADHAGLKVSAAELSPVVMPALLQRSGPYELLWFDNGQAILLPTFHALQQRFGPLEFAAPKKLGPLEVRQGGKLFGQLWPSPVPNREMAAAALHELAMRNPPPKDPELLKERVADQLRSGLRGDVAALWKGVMRALDWLEGRSTTGSYVWGGGGITEWSKCSALEWGDGGYFFKGTDIPATRLFHDFEQGKNVAQFLAGQPAVTEKQVAIVLEHLVLSLCT